MRATNTLDKLQLIAFIFIFGLVIVVTHHFATTPMSAYQEDPYAVPTYDGPTYEPANHGTY